MRVLPKSKALLAGTLLQLSVERALLERLLVSEPLDVPGQAAAQQAAGVAGVGGQPPLHG